MTRFRDQPHTGEQCRAVERYAAEEGLDPAAHALLQLISDGQTLPADPLMTPEGRRALIETIHRDNAARIADTLADIELRRNR